MGAFEGRATAAFIPGSESDCSLTISKHIDPHHIHTMGGAFISRSFTHTYFFRLGNASFWFWGDSLPYSAEAWCRGTLLGNVSVGLPEAISRALSLETGKIG